MNDLVSFATLFMTITLYSIFLGACIYGLNKIIAKYNSNVNYWRDYWLLLSLLCLLPFFYGFVPSNSFNIDLMEMSHIIEYDNVKSIVPLETAITKASSLSSLTIMEILALFLSVLIIVGTIYQLLRFFVRLNHVIAVIKSSKKLEDVKGQMTECHYNLINEIKCKHKTKIRFTSLCISPFVFQFRKKVLVLPITIIRDLSEQQLSLIMKHELIHMKNHDSLVVLGSNFIQSLLWFNPFTRFFQEKMLWALEVNCDNTVLEKKPTLRKAYAQLMLKIFTQTVTKDGSLLVSTFALKTNTSVTQRINNIVFPASYNNNANYWKLRLFGILVVFGLVTFLVQTKLDAALFNSPVNMLNPVENSTVKLAYGLTKQGKFHHGVDLQLLSNVPVLATADGVVHFSSHQDKGKTELSVVIEHSSGLQTAYKHLDNKFVEENQKVFAGQVLGTMGNPDILEQKHLHLEIYKNNKRINPEEYISFTQ